VLVAGAFGLAITAIALIVGSPDGTGAIFGLYSAGLGLWCAFVAIFLASLLRRNPQVALVLLAIVGVLAVVEALTTVTA